VSGDREVALVELDLAEEAASAEMQTPRLLRAQVHATLEVAEQLRLTREPGARRVTREELYDVIADAAAKSGRMRVTVTDVAAVRNAVWEAIYG
jgi:hypothetical protein